MSILRKVLKIFLVVLGCLVLLFLVVVGPWPTYKDSEFARSSYYQRAIESITASAAESELSSTPGRLQAGWASRSISPPELPPLAGYGARPGDKRAVGVRDAVEVRVLALSDGQDTIVLTGADLLIIPPNVAALVREQVAARTGLSPNDILFNASHTHCGPGGFAPGLASRLVNGPFDPAMPGFLAGAFADAIDAAVKALEPARLGAGNVDAPAYIRNRTRQDGPVDAELNFMKIEQDDGDGCYLVSYNAHPTNFGDEMKLLSAEYPGELVRYLQGQTDHPDAVYLGGAVGSMGPRAPEGPDADARMVAMGQALAKLVLEHAEGLEMREHLDIASIGVPVGMPSMQMRPFEGNTNWRLSPVLGSLLGAKSDGWFQVMRVGDSLITGSPCDFGGGISLKWKAWGSARGLDVWPLSFCGAYCGYFSPDEHYLSTPLNYETGLMSWYGPNIEAYFTALFEHATGALHPAPSPAG